MDVNVLVAWGWSDHVDHEKVVNWIAAVRQQQGTIFLTSSIPQLGFVRVSVQRTNGLVTVKEACETLSGMLDALGDRHVFLADDQSVINLPDWCRSASRTSDSHLLQLAESHQAKLTTLDISIPGALLIPA
jgi:predicted nucleic acid-binding protein